MFATLLPRLWIFDVCEAGLQAVDYTENTRVWAFHLRQLLTGFGAGRMAEQKKIHVSELCVGMYICKLDRDWVGSPFALQGLLVQTPEDIDVVSDFCEHVWIEARPASSSSPTAAATGKSQTRNRYINKVPLREEQENVLRTFRKARSVTKNLLDGIRLSQAIDTVEAKAIVTECVNSILRNPDALMWVAKIREANEYTAEHCLNVCILAIAFGRHLGLNEAELHNLGLCGLLHDVGKMKVPSEILDKPGPLTPQEMRIVMAHSVHGRNLLMAAKNMYRGAVDVAYSHHERLDGTGYPRQLPGRGISYYSRIIAIVDAYDAITADRCYAEAQTSTWAVKELYRERDTHFDKDLVLEFIKSVGLYPPGSIAELHSGHVGIVVETNHQYRHLPRVVLLLDGDKKPMPKPTSLDLAAIERGKLDRKFLIKQIWRDSSFGISLADCQQRGLQLVR